MTDAVSQLLSDSIARTRAFAGLARRADRGLIEVTGGDRERWLNGMVTNDVSALVAGPKESGCYTLLLSRQGRILADFRVLLRPDRYWLETRRDAIDRIREQLDRYIIADDVEVRDISPDFEQWSLEGPQALAVLSAATGTASDVELSPNACGDVTLGGVACVAAAFGDSRASAYRLIASEGSSEAIVAALGRAAAQISPDGRGLADLDAAAVEVLRIEAGAPMLGCELDESVLPDEARLGHAISTTKGCYTGQEVIARLRSRGKVKHLLVGLRFVDGALPDVKAALAAEGKRVGEVTSRAQSPAFGDIGLGYVRVEFAQPGQRLELDDARAEVAALPFARVADAAGDTTGRASPQ